MITDGFCSQQARARLHRKDMGIMVSLLLQNQSKRTPQKIAIMNFMIEMGCLERVCQYLNLLFFFKENKMKTHVF